MLMYNCLMQNNNFLGTEPISKLLIKLSLPTIAAQIINMAYNLIDRIYIGRIADVGHLALTGVGVCLPIIMLVSAFAALISSGGAPKAAIALGRKRKDDAELILGNCFTTLIVISIIITTFFFTCREDLLMFFGASSETIQYSLDYLSIYLLGTICVQISIGMNAFITTQGFATKSMQTILIGAICNIILDPIFIFVFNMGVSGAAWATIISQAVSAIWVLIFLTGKKTTIKIKLSNMMPQATIIIGCMVLGLASFIMQATESLVMITFNTSLLKYGGDIAVGAMTILASCMQLTQLPLQGFGQGAQPIISYNYGAKNKERIKEAIKILIKVGFTFTLVAWSLAMFTPHLLIRIFTPNPELINYSVWAIRIYMASTLFFGIQIACQMSLTAMSRAKESILIALTRKIFLLIPLIYLLPSLLENKVFAVFLSEPIADGLSVLFTILVFTSVYKKVVNQIDNQI